MDRVKEGMIYFVQCLCTRSAEYGKRNRRSGKSRSGNRQKSGVKTVGHKKQWSQKPGKRWVGVRRWTNWLLVEPPVSGHLERGRRGRQGGYYKNACVQWACWQWMPVIWSEFSCSWRKINNEKHRPWSDLGEWVLQLTCRLEKQGISWESYELARAFYNHGLGTYFLKTPIMLKDWGEQSISWQEESGKSHTCFEGSLDWGIVKMSS